MKKRISKKPEFATKEELEYAISDLEFLIESYIRSAMQTVAYALPQLVNSVTGSADKLGRAINLLEQVATAAEKRKAELESKRQGKGGK